MEQPDLFGGAVTGLPDVWHTFGPCVKGQHAVCGRSYLGCGWDGYRVQPAPMHYCDCTCHVRQA